MGFTLWQALMVVFRNATPSETVLPCLIAGGGSASKHHGFQGFPLNSAATPQIFAGWVWVNYRVYSIPYTPNVDLFTCQEQHSNNCGTWATWGLEKLNPAFRRRLLFQTRSSEQGLQMVIIPLMGTCRKIVDATTC